MINLLPKDQLKNLRASKQNVILLRYIVMLLMAAGLIAGMFGFMFITLGASKQVAISTKAENDKKAAAYKDTETQAKALNQSLTQVKAILSQRVDYSKVLIKIAKVLPSNVSIQSIQLESKLFEGTKEISIIAPNLDSVIATKAAFEESKLFSSVKINAANEVKDETHATFSLNFNRKEFEL